MATASNATIKVDVMRQVTRTQERFVCTLNFPHLSCATLNLQRLYEFVLSKRSDLRDQVITIYLGKGNDAITIYPPHYKGVIR